MRMPTKITSLHAHSTSRYWMPVHKFNRFVILIILFVAMQKNVTSSLFEWIYPETAANVYVYTFSFAFGTNLPWNVYQNRERNCISHLNMWVLLLIFPSNNRYRSNEVQWTICLEIRLAFLGINSIIITAINPTHAMSHTQSQHRIE